MSISMELGVRRALLPDAVREQARAGDGWVKLVGDWIHREVGDLAPVWPDDVLAELHRREGISGIDEKKARTGE